MSIMRLRFSLRIRIIAGCRIFHYNTIKSENKEAIEYGTLKEVRNGRKRRKNVKCQASS